MRHLKILIVITLTLINVTGLGQVDIENKIISSLINSEIKSMPNDTIFNKKGELKVIVIQKTPNIILVNETETFLFDPQVDSLGMFKINGLPSIDTDCYSNFKEINRVKIKIDSISDFMWPIKYISSNEIETIFKQGGWDNYHKILGYSGLVKVSRPGLNKDKTKAFIYYSIVFHELDGAGFYLILEKVDEKWIVKETMPAWKS